MAVIVTVSVVQAQTTTIVVFGDSLTAGYGLPQGDGFTHQLEAWLIAQGADVKVINAGVSGDTTAGGLSRLDWTLTPDVDAIIITLGGNDYLRGLDPTASRENLNQILAKSHKAGVKILLVGLSAGANYGLEYKQQFDGMFVEIAAKYNVPLYPDFFAGLRAAAGDANGVASFMQADGIHPNKKGVTVIVAAIGSSVSALLEATN